MYFFNIKQLKEDIVKDKFNESDRFTYLFIYILLNTILLELPLFYEPTGELTQLDYWDSFIAISITVLGTYSIYKANGGNQGKDFLGKYFSITWVMAIRLFIPMFIAFYLFIFIELPSPIDEIAQSIIVLVYVSVLYYSSYKHVVDINKQIALL